MLAVFGGLQTANAQEWRFEPILRVAGDFDDNPFLSIRTDVDENAEGTILEGALRASYESDRSAFVLTPRVRSRDYGDQISIRTISS